MAKQKYVSSKECHAISEDVEIEKKDAKEVEEFFHIHNRTATKPYIVNLTVNGKEIQFEVDTGSGVTVVNQETYYEHFKQKRLEKCDIILKSYTGEQIPVVGMLHVDVEYRDRKGENMKLMILKGNNVNLVGRNWINQIRLKWADIMNAPKIVRESAYLIQSERTGKIEKKLRELKEKHATLFSGKLLPRWI